MLKRNQVRAHYFRFFSFGIFFSAIFLFLQSTGWPLLVRWQIKGHLNYIDLNSVLGSADCFRVIGFDIYNYPIGHECAYNYGSWLMRIISFIGLGENHTNLVGSIFIVAISFLLAFIMSRVPLRRTTLLFGLLMFISPPIMLLLERGNIDSLIFILIWIAAVVFSPGRPHASLALVVLSALFKFYTVGLAALLVFSVRSKYSVIVWMSAVVIAIAQILSDFSSGPGFINTEWTSFGAPVFGIYFKYLDIDIPYLLSLLIGCLLLVIAIWFISRSWSPFSKLYSDLIKTSLSSIYSYHLFIFFSVVHSTCYILGMNFDYRLIMLSISNFILLSQAKLESATKLTIGLSTVFIMWTSYNLQISQPIGDALIGVTTAFYICIIWQYFLKLQVVVNFIESRNRLPRKFQ